MGFLAGRMASGVSMIRNVVFISLIGFLVAWTLISIWGMIQAITGFTDTYPQSLHPLLR